MGLCTLYDHTPQCTSSNEIIALSTKLMLFFYTTLRNIKISLKHPGKCTWPISAFTGIHWSTPCKANVAGCGVSPQLGPGRSVPLLAGAPCGMQGWSPALPPPPGPAAVLQWLQADLGRHCRARGRRGCLGEVWSRTSLHCFLKLLRGFILRWRHRRYWPHWPEVYVYVHTWVRVLTFRLYVQRDTGAKRFWKLIL